MDKILNQDCKYIFKNSNIKKFEKKKILILGGNGFFCNVCSSCIIHDKL